MAELEDGSSSAGPSEQQEEEEKEFLPGFPTLEDYSKVSYSTWFYISTPHSVTANYETDSVCSRP